MQCYYVTQNLEDALRLDKENRNTRWKDAMALDLSQISLRDQRQETSWLQIDLCPLGV